MDKNSNIKPLVYSAQPGQTPNITISSTGSFTYTLPDIYRNNRWSIPITGLTAHQVYQKIKAGYILGVCYECKGTGETINPYMTVDVNGNIRQSTIQCSCCKGKKKILYSIEFKKLAEAVLNHQTNLEEESKEKDDNDL